MKIENKVEITGSIIVTEKPIKKKLTNNNILIPMIAVFLPQWRSKNHSHISPMFLKKYSIILIFI